MLTFPVDRWDPHKDPLEVAAADWQSKEIFSIQANLAQRDNDTARMELMQMQILQYGKCSITIKSSAMKMEPNLSGIRLAYY